MSDGTKNLNLSGDATFGICGRVVVRRIGSDTLLVPVSGPAAGGRVFPVNDSALCVWNSLAEGGTVCAASEALVEQYGIDPKQALADSRECAGDFLNEGLIEEKPA